MFKQAFSHIKRLFTQETETPKPHAFLGPESGQKRARGPDDSPRPFKKQKQKEPAPEVGKAAEQRKVQQISGW
jgi:hypothetical protein